MSGSPKRLTVALDTLSYFGGWVLMDSQVGIVSTPPASPNETAMWIAAVLIGGPLMNHLIRWRFGGGTPEATNSPPSPPAPADSSAQQQSS